MIMCTQEEFAKSRTDLEYLRKKRVSIEEQRRKLLQQDDYDIDKLESYVAELHNLDRQIRKKQKEVVAENKRAFKERTGYTKIL